VAPHGLDSTSGSCNDSPLHVLNLKIELNSFFRMFLKSFSVEFSAKSDDILDSHFIEFLTARFRYLRFLF